MTVPDDQNDKLENMRLEEIAVIKEIRKCLSQIERREDRKIPHKGRKALVQALTERHIRTLRKMYGVNENTGRPIGESLTDFLE